LRSRERLGIQQMRFSVNFTTKVTSHDFDTALRNQLALSSRWDQGQVRRQTIYMCIPIGNYGVVRFYSIINPAASRRSFNCQGCLLYRECSKEETCRGGCSGNVDETCSGDRLVIYISRSPKGHFLLFSMTTHSYFTAITCHNFFAKALSSSTDLKVLSI
jgi:hypothetical protein